MKKTSVWIIALAGTLILGGGGVLAAGQIARSNAIGEENARNFAYVDAGILPENAEYVSTKFDFSKGRFVYEIEFIADGTKYEYTLDSSTGAVLEREKEAIRDYAALSQSPTTETLPMAQQPETQAQPQTISLAEAKELVLKELGLEASQASFLTAGLEREDGILVYDMELKDAQGNFHEFELDALSGEIRKESHRLAQASAMDPSQATADQSSEAATAPAQNPLTTQPASQMIGVEKAKEIALKDAGKNASAVVMTKAKQEWDDGRQIFDIEFYEKGQMEYEYEIDAFSGKILEKSVEPTDAYKAAQAAARGTTAAQTPTQASTQTPTQASTQTPTQAPTQAPTQPASQMIGVEKAKEIALKDAGKSASAVVMTKAKQEWDDGRQIFDIEFYEKGQMEYEYEIDAFSGKILEKSVEPTDAYKAAQAAAKATTAAQTPTQASTQPAPAPTAAPTAAPTQPAPQMIGVEKAKEIALKDAGKSASAVVMTKAKQEWDDGRQIFDIEFYEKGQMEYEYEIDAFNGKILEKSVEPTDAYKAAQAAAKATTAAPAPTQASTQPAPAPTAAQTPTQASTQPAPASTAAPTQPAPQMIGVEKAKEIALKDAGKSASAVVMTKAKQEWDDGRQIFDIEFYEKGQMEYEYEIDAFSGRILDKSVEPTDAYKAAQAAAKATTAAPAPTQAPTQPAPTQAAPQVIGVEKAKSIALKDAGRTAAEVTFSKAMQDTDDGRAIYEIEFFVRGQMEYDYEIDAYTGRIIDKDMEEWDD